MNTNGEGKQDQRSTEAADLLEEFWFFRNLLLLQRKNTHTQLMKRCYSDPSSSSNNQEMISFKDPTDSPPKKLPQLTGAPAVKSTETKKSSDSSRVLLMRTPSLPPCCLEKDDDVVEEEQRGSRSQSRLTKHNSYKGTTIHLSRDMENSDDPSKEKLVKKFDKKSSSSKKLSRGPQGSQNERSDLNRIGPTVEDDDGPSMDQIYQLMLGKSEPSSNHTEASSSSKSSSPKKFNESISNVYDCDGTEPPLRGLVRAPSLPPCVGRVEVFDEQRGSQSLTRLSRSNRQASLNLSEIFPPLRFSKGAPTYLSTDKEMKRRILNRTKSMRSRGELESEEVQGFKDLGFTFDRKNLNPNLVNILPGLQEKNKEEEEEEENEGKEPAVKKGPYLSESWLSHNFAPPIPKWTPKGGGGGSPDDLKTQIKFWARAVASNVGQEC